MNARFIPVINTRARAIKGSLKANAAFSGSKYPFKYGLFQISSVHSNR